MALPWLERSMRPFALTISIAACAHGVERPIDLSDAGKADVAGTSSGAAGATSGSSSGGAPVADANAGGASGSDGAGTTGTGGMLDGSGGAAGSGVADARAESSSADSMIEAGRDALDGAVDARVDASVDAPIDAGCGNATQCALKAALVHRYMFSGTGMTVSDSVGTAHGRVVNGQLNGNGTLVLSGSGYVDLPNGILRQLTNATLEIWVTWSGGAVWQRIFDFGSSTAGEDMPAMAATSLYVTPTGDGPTVLFAAFKRADQAGPAETRALGAQALATGAMVHIAVVLDDTNNQLALYRNGAPEGSVAWNDSLSLLVDVNNWLGRSQYVGDASLVGTLHEFRIYNAALSAAQVRASYMGGTDPPFLN